MKQYLIEVIHVLFYAYTILLFVRIILSWFPAWYDKKWARFVSFYTDPFLNIFRKILPPLGGVLDLSPVLAFLSLQLIEWLLLWFLKG